MLYFNNLYKIPNWLVQYIEEFEENHTEMKTIVLRKYPHQRIAHTVKSNLETIPCLKKAYISST